MHSSGHFQPARTGQGVFPHPAQPAIPIWLGVGGTPASFVRAGVHGLPLMVVVVIGGTVARFRPLVDLWREAGLHAGHPADRPRAGGHAMGFVAETDAEARGAPSEGGVQVHRAREGAGARGRGGDDASTAPPRTRGSGA